MALWRTILLAARRYLQTNASDPTPFPLTVHSGAQASALLGALAAHHAHAAPDELLDVLIAALQQIPAKRAARELVRVLSLLEHLADPLGEDAYALTTIASALALRARDMKP